MNLLEPSGFGTRKNGDKNWSSTASHLIIAPIATSFVISYSNSFSSSAEKCNSLLKLRDRWGPSRRGISYPFTQFRTKGSLVIFSRYERNWLSRPATNLTLLFISLHPSEAVACWLTSRHCCMYSCWPAEMGGISSDTVLGPDTSSPVSHTGPASLKCV